ncbi:MAG: hypothetical protein Q4C91_20420 [Eubacteriales bacterium]|nr:hypothetical protein [Eubacteriales bacterium]
MKKWVKFLGIIFCLLLVQTSIFAVKAPAIVQAGTVKSGLKKENGRYYYYAEGVKVKNTWKTIKTVSNGKTISGRYFFGRDGAAYAGKKVKGAKVPAVKKIGGKYYGFGISGRMLKGTYVINEKFYVFHSKTGVYDSERSVRLRKASEYEKDAKTLRKLLGKPQKTVTRESCYGEGRESILYYPNFMVCLYKNEQGKEIVLGILGR